jgi:SAM-dependent methyltransferase
MTRKTEHAPAGQHRADAGHARTQLREWYRRRLGRWLIDFERAQLEEVLSNLFGYYLVQVGSTMDDYLLGASRIRNQIIIDDAWPINCPNDDDARVLGMYSCADILPLQNDSIDVVMLPHTLEFEPSPHQVLREVERVLVSEGHVVILGFNPWSLWGGRRLIGRWRRQAPPWHGSFRSAMRIKDWLALLGFDVVLTRYCFFRPPMQHQGIMSRLTWLERIGARWWPYLGGVYIIVAKKQVVRLIPIRPRWRPRRSLIQPDVPKPTT